MMQPFKSALLACCAVMFLHACGEPPEMQKAAPALWLVEDADTQIYLLGSMHALPDHLDWSGGAVQTAIDKADTLILELSSTETAKVSSVYARLSPRTSPLAVEERLSPSARSAYDRLAFKDQLALSDKLDDWALMLALGHQASKRVGVTPDNGVETKVSAQFRKAGKKIEGLETAEMQIMMFENLPASTQGALLNNALTKADKAPAAIKSLVTAWSSGDVDAMQQQIAQDTAAAPLAHQRLITDRNHRWASWATQRMDSPGTLLVAVGAGHMVGEDGLPALLAQKGFTVTRLQ
jgi:uncharacterized protein YbaP (TraB family)